MPTEFEQVLFQLEQARGEIQRKDQQIFTLDKEIQTLRGQVMDLQKDRPKLAPENLINTFRLALAKMQEGLQIPEAPYDYQVGGLEAELKVMIALDEAQNIVYLLPGVGDSLPAHQVTTLRFAIKPVAKAALPPAEAIEVPSLIGMTLAVAQAAIERANFVVGTLVEQVSASTPGLVIEQYPERYARTTARSAIDLVISKRPETKVPAVLGLSLKAAAEALFEARLAIGKILEQPSNEPSGCVIAQNPAAGAVVAIESQVDLTLAVPNPVKVPPLVGKKVEAAVKLLQALGLKMGEVTLRPSQEPEGTILEQDPEAGVEILPGGAVDLVVAKPGKAVVPDVTGLEHEDAEKEIRHAGLKVHRFVWRKSRKTKGSVIGQSIEAGRELDADSEISLTLSQGP